MGEGDGGGEGARAAEPGPASGGTPAGGAAGGRQETQAEPNQEDDSAAERRFFGPGEKAWMIAEVADDNGSAAVRQLSLEGVEGVDVAAVIAALERHYGIVAGVNEEVVEALLEEAADGPVSGAFAVANAEPATPGESGRVELVFLEELGEEGVQLSYAALRAALERDDLKAVLADDLLGLLVAPGQSLALLHPPGEGEPGVDVLGNSVTSPGADVDLRAGEHVARAGESFTAETYGYVCLVENELSVLSPIWMDGDLMEAHFVRFPQPRASAIESDWLTTALQERGVTSGIDEVSVERLCASSGSATEKGAVLLASGQAAVHGVDGHVEYAIDMEKRAGKILADGSVDLRERNAAVGVEGDQVIGELIPPTPGQAGQNLKGETLAARDGQERIFTAGENVKAEPGDGGRQRFVAEIQGAVSLSGDTIQVRPVFTVSGDIDYNTGNLDLPTDVEVSGSVRSGFTVRAGGSVTVGGSVEPGAEIHSRADVVAAKGIFGDATKVVALGDVTAKFVQNSTVMAHGNITVGAYIIHGRVRAGGCVRVESGGGSRGGCIMGGEVIAAGGVEARLIGSGEGDRTLVGIGSSPEQAGELARLNQTLRALQVEIRKLVVSLGLNDESQQELDRLVRRTSGAAKQRAAEAARELARLRTERDASRQKQQDLEAEVDASLRRAWVRAREEVFADVQVQFGRDIRTVSSTVAQAEFFLGDEGVRWRPLQTSADEGGESVAAGDSGT